MFIGIYRCVNLLLLETYTTKTDSDMQLPSFLDITAEVTENSEYSMFNLSKIDRV